MTWQYVPTVSTLLSKYTRNELINMRVSKASNEGLSKSDRDRWLTRIDEAVSIEDSDSE